MIILAHRGYWKKAVEKNTEKALKKAFEKGYGIESDIRDYDQKLVISHDPANSSNMPAEALFEELLKYDNKLCFALNIKADGLGSHAFWLSSEVGSEALQLAESSGVRFISYKNTDGAHGELLKFLEDIKSFRKVRLNDYKEETAHPFALVHLIPATFKNQSDALSMYDLARNRKLIFESLFAALSDSPL